MNFPKLTDAKLLSRLQPPTSKVRMVLDTDTYNEVDDQFALVHALLSPDRLKVEAIYAAPYFNNRSTGPADGMEKSYEEIAGVLGLPTGTVKSRINRARNLLKEKLRDFI